MADSSSPNALLTERWSEDLVSKIFFFLIQSFQSAALRLALNHSFFNTNEGLWKKLRLMGEICTVCVCVCVCVCVQCTNETLIICCYAVKKRGQINFISKEESRRHEGMFSANRLLCCKYNVAQTKLEMVQNVTPQLLM